MRPIMIGLSLTLLTILLCSPVTPSSAAENDEDKKWAAAVFDCEAVLDTLRRRYPDAVQKDPEKMVEFQRLLSRMAELANVPDRSASGRPGPLPPLASPPPASTEQAQGGTPSEPRTTVAPSQRFNMTSGPLEFGYTRQLQLPEDPSVRGAYEQALAALRWSAPGLKAELTIGDDQRVTANISIALTYSKRDILLEWQPLFIAQAGAQRATFREPSESQCFSDPRNFLWNFAAETVNGMNSLAFRQLFNPAPSLQLGVDRQILGSLTWPSEWASLRPRSILIQSPDARNILYQLSLSNGYSYTQIVRWDEGARAYRPQNSTRNSPPLSSSAIRGRLYAITSDLFYSQAGMASLPVIRDLLSDTEKPFENPQQLLPPRGMEIFSTTASPQLTKMLRLARVPNASGSGNRYAANYYDLSNDGLTDPNFRVNLVAGSDADIATWRRPVLANNKPLFVTMSEDDFSSTPQRRSFLRVYKVNRNTGRISLDQDIVFNDRDIPLTGLFTPDDSQFMVFMSSGAVHVFDVAATP